MKSLLKTIKKNNPSKGLPFLSVTKTDASQKLPWITRDSIFVENSEEIPLENSESLLDEYSEKYSHHFSSQKDKETNKEEYIITKAEQISLSELLPQNEELPLEEEFDEIDAQSDAVEDDFDLPDEQDEDEEDILTLTTDDLIPQNETTEKDEIQDAIKVPEKTVLLKKGNETLFDGEVSEDYPQIGLDGSVIDTGKKKKAEFKENIPDAIFSRVKINDNYIIPSTFFNNSTPGDSSSTKAEITRNSQLLIATLADFGIEARVVNVNRGPVITLYEVQIAAGIKVSKIVGLSDDIAMALAAYRVRIVAPIPGKSAIGVEIPNKNREDVTIGDIISSQSYKKVNGKLKVALGKDVLGVPVMLDLKRLPHLLIAGATGSGKSVCVNSIVTSLIYNYDPNQVRFIMIDPKMVELQLYNGLSHLLTPVITEPHTAPLALKWATFEMERRYKLLSLLKTRDIDSYNEKAQASRGRVYEHLPYIVLIIDELADLMMVAPKDIEGYITRIAQKARAVGIHLVLATQRPSVDVITGIIKANFPARIAFQVAQKTDSRTIIDQNGAEKLLGKGDMLYLSPVSSYPERIQGSFVSEDEIIDLVTHLKTLSSPDYIDLEAGIFDAESDLVLEDNGDELFTEALKIVEETRKASASYLQRRLSIGYNRAARIVEMMEELGYVGPQQGSKPREVLI